MRNYLFVFLLFMSLLAGVEAGAREEFRFRTFSPEGGFSYDGVDGIAQDGEGFIWVMLSKELLRFDGYEYKRYDVTSFRPDLSPDVDFLGVVSDMSGNLFVQTSQALFRYYKERDEFVPVLSGALSHLFIDQHNVLWASRDGALFRSALDHPSLDPCLCEGKPLLGIRYFAQSGADFFMASRSGNVYRYGSSGKVLQLRAPKYNDLILGLVIRDGQLLFLDGHMRIISIDPDTGREACLQSLEMDDEVLPSTVNTMQMDRNGRIWIGSAHGLYVLDLERGTQDLYVHSKADAFSLPNNSIWTVFNDRDNNLWLGHYAGGLSFVDPDERMKTVTFTPDNSALVNGLVSSFAEDSEFLYVGTEGGGVHRIRKDSYDFSFFQHQAGQNSLAFNNVKSLVKHGNDLWTAMFRGGLDKIDLSSGRFEHFRHGVDSSSLVGNDLRKIISDGDRGLWIAYQYPKPVISYLSYADESFRHFPLGEGGYIFDICKDKDCIWALTRRSLFRLDTHDGSVRMSTPPVMSGQALCADSTGRVWIGTIGNGLMCYDPDTDSFSHAESLQEYRVRSIFSLMFVDGMLWLGTDNGMIRYSPENGTSIVFNDTDGFQGQVYYPLASYRGEDGLLYFGGTNGFTIFDPSWKGMVMHEPRARLSDFYINHQKSPLDMAGQRRLLLTWRQTNLGFTFSSDDYHAPEKERFRCRLKGYEREWTVLDASSRTVMYSKLPAGNYVLQYEADGGLGFGNVPSELPIRIRPALWASPWAYAFYLLCVLAMVAWMVHYFKEKRRMQMQLYEDGLDKKKKEELHQTQLNFFTNISHDLRTPLSLILATLDSMDQEGPPENPRLHGILRNNAHRLLSLVNELMDFRRAESDKIVLHVEPIPLNETVEEISGDFVEYARQHDIRFSVSPDPALEVESWLDKAVVEKIVLNLLNNAFKYTPDGGSVELRTYGTPSDYKPGFAYGYSFGLENVPEESVVISVKDTGVGISEESISNVFDRYYTTHSDDPQGHLGTGIGLALVKSLVRIHKGGMSVFSERKHGSEFNVFLPVGKNAYAEEAEPVDGFTGGSGTFFDADTMRTDHAEGTILLVEDNKDLRELVAGFLSLHYKIFQAADGVEALQVLRVEDVDMVITDIVMPRMDGISLCRTIKQDVDTSHIPVMLLTAKSGTEAQLSGVDSGADYFFTKPVDFKLLLSTISNVFKHRDDLREHYARNYWAESSDLSASKQDKLFLDQLTAVIDKNLCQNTIDVNSIASELCMSRTKLYQKIKTLTGKNIVEFINNYRMRKAARLIMEGRTLGEIPELVGLRSRSYFDKAFKKEFGLTPAQFVARHQSDS